MCFLVTVQKSFLGYKRPKCFCLGYQSFFGYTIFFWDTKHSFLTFSAVKGVLSMLELFLTIWKVRSGKGGSSTVGGPKAAAKAASKAAAETAAKAKRHEGGAPEGPEGRAPEGWRSERWGARISRFCSFSRLKFHSLCSRASSRGISVVFSMLFWNTGKSY